MRWEIEPLKECAEIHFGTRVIRRKDAGVAYPVYGGGGATFFIDEFNRENELVISRFAMSEKCVRFVEGKFFLNDSGLTVKTKNKVRLSQDFLEWQCRAKSPVIYSLGRGTAQKNLNTKEFKRLPFSIPPLEEQQRIVELLDEAFEAIDKAKANIERNLANARELFQSRLNEIFANPSEDWEVKPLGEVCNFVRGPFGGALKKSCFVSEGYAVYEQKHPIHGDFNTFRYFINSKKFDEMSRFEVKPGDVLMSCSGTIGRTKVVPDSAPKGIINQALLKLRPREALSPQFLKIWMESDSFFTQIKERSGGAALQNVASVKILKTIKMPLPPSITQEVLLEGILHFQNVLNELESRYQEELGNLEELRQSILEQAFEGKLTEEG